LEKGHFQDGVQDGCRELKFSISKAIGNIEKSFWCQTVGLNSSFNILKVPFLENDRFLMFRRKGTSSMLKLELKPTV